MLSIITWDANYRDFIYCIESLERQSLKHSQYEVLIVEQFSEKKTKEFELKSKRKSISKVVSSYARSSYNVKYLHMNLDKEVYNVGKILNFGISQSNGDYIVVIDGDMIFDYDFLEQCLIELKHKSYISCFRKTANFPSGKTSWSDWKEGDISIKSIKKASLFRYTPVVKKLNNFGQMLGYSRRDYIKLGGYEESRLFSTSWSKVHKDFYSRLHSLRQTEITIIKAQAYHPWHPILLDSDFENNGISNPMKYKEELLSIQDQYIKECKERNLYNRLSKEINELLIEFEISSEKSICVAEKVWSIEQDNSAVLYPKNSVQKIRKKTIQASWLSMLDYRLTQRFYKWLS
jgi:glycosyltransferase involved in cell wall biosynthesis